MSARRALAVAAAALVVASCGVAFPDDDGDCAAKVELNARLEVHLDEPRVIWATDLATGEVISLRIPGGYGVTSGDEMIDPTGRAFARTGDLIVSGCRDYVQDAVMVRAEDVRPAPD